MSNPVLDIEVSLRGGMFNLCRYVGQFERTTNSQVEVKILGSGLNGGSTFMQTQLKFADAGMATLFKLGFVNDADFPSSFAD